ncbi:MAG: SMP-30/gluconolactonase/LRE family protein [Thalassotalea sp.]
MSSESIVGELILTLPVGNQLGEGVQWHIESQAIWWTDIEKSYLYSYHLLKNNVVKHKMPERVGCFAFIENDPRLLVAFESGFAFYSYENKQLDWIDKPDIAHGHNRFNDGRVDREGNFWAGTMIQAPDSDSTPASLYRLSSEQLMTEKKISGITVSNGLCFSIDGKTLYHADSPSREIMQYELDSKGQLSNPRLFATTAENSYPDGATIDADGYLWNAQWGGSRVVRYALDGEIDFILNVPVTQPSCVAIGGPNMDWLIITSAKQDLSAEHLATEVNAGHVFIYQLNKIKGLPEDKVKLDLKA